MEAKVDRLEGIVHFTKNQDPNEMLNDWYVFFFLLFRFDKSFINLFSSFINLFSFFRSTNISDLMGLVLKSTHLINREEMVHKHMAGLNIADEKK